MRENAADPDDESVTTGVRHALGWLVVGNIVGLYLSLLLLFPGWQWGPLTYGRWVPVHLNVQLYGWTALPLVAWLFRLYQVNGAKVARWAAATVWAWTAALVAGAAAWLQGETGGKVFLDWKGGSLWGFITAQVILWVVLALAWREQSGRWEPRRKWLALGGLVGLALVPAVIVVAASPATYPPVDPLTGGPTGSSLLGSSLIVVGLMLMLPRVVSVAGIGRAGWGTWCYFGFCWIFFGIAEAVGGTHLDWWQNGSLLLMPPWAWLLVRDWSGFAWPVISRAWLGAMFGWWALLVATAYLMYFPWILDRIKFTQGLVAHSHLAMAGFTTAFCALLIVLLTGKRLGGTISFTLWQMSAVTMVAALAWMGWQEGKDPSWMVTHPAWRELGLVVRSVCGLVMLMVSAVWFISWKPR